MKLDLMDLFGGGCFLISRPCRLLLNLSALGLEKDAPLILPLAASVLEDMLVNFYKMMKLPQHRPMYWCGTRTWGVRGVFVLKEKPYLIKIMCIY